MFVINSLVVKEIKKSIDLMDKFEDGDYEYLELEHWYWVKDSKDRKWSFDDNTGVLYISLIITKNRNHKKELCSYQPTMTELRQKQHHGIVLDEEYQNGSIDQIIRDACKSWTKEEYIELEKQICLRAQTSWNRIDYGCEWLGGGDWEEKTLYGETTDFYISGIILREPYKSTEQEAREIVTELKNRVEENDDFIIRASMTIKHVDQKLIHKSYGLGTVVEFEENKVRVQFTTKTSQFIFPDSILQGYFTVPEHNDVIENAMAKWDENVVLSKIIKRFEYAKGNSIATYEAVRDYKNENSKVIW